MRHEPLNKLRWRRITRALLLMLVLLVAACRRDPPRPPVIAPEPDPTDGICEDTLSPARTIEEELQRAEASVDNGCPRPALLRLGRLESGGALTAKQTGYLRLIANEARLDVLTLGYGRRSPTTDIDLLVHPPWMTLKTEHTEGNLQSFLRLAEDVENESLPVDVRDSGRLIALATRSMLTRPCGDGLNIISKDTRDKFWQVYAQTVMAGRKGGLPTARPILRREDGRLELWRCNLQGAAAAYQAASTRLAIEGAQEEAALAALAAIEADVFPSGRADDLAVYVLCQGDMLKQAAEEAASRVAPAALQARAARLDKKVKDVLTEVGGARSSAALRAQATWVRAVGALRLGADAAGAHALAESALADARAAHRADLIDAASVVLGFSAFELGQWREAERLFRTLERSFVQRGALGERARLIQQLVSYASLGALRGDYDAGIRLLTSALPLVEASSCVEYARLRGSLQKLFIDSGRFEEALTEIEKTLAGLDASLNRSSTMATTLGSVIREQFKAALAFVLERLQGDDAATTTAGAALISEAPQVVRDLFRALERGDEAALDEIIEDAQADDPTRIAVDAALVTFGACGKVGKRAHALADTMMLLTATAGALAGTITDYAAKDEPGALTPKDRLDAGMSYASGVLLNYQIAGRISTCAAAQHDVSLARKATQMMRGASIGGATDPATELIFSAGELEAGGQHMEAADKYVAAARAIFLRTGVSAQGTMGASQLAEGYYRAAVASLLAAKPPRVERAVNLVEEMSGRHLRAARATAAGTPGAVLEGLVAQERRIAGIQAKLRALAALIQHAESNAIRHDLESSGAAIERELTQAQSFRDQIARELQTSNPPAFRAAALGSPLSMAEIQHRLRPDEALVYYAFAGPLGGWAIVVDNTVARAVPVTDTGLARALQRHRSLLRQHLTPGRGFIVSGAPSPHQNDRETSEQIRKDRALLYRALVSPIEPFVPAGKRILLVPGPELADVPFAALGTPEEPWIARNPLRILPGAYLLTESPRRATLSGPVLILGDPQFAEPSADSTRGSAAGHAFRQLKGTRSEAIAVARLFDTSPLLGPDATEEVTVAGMLRASIIHIGTHGLADAARPSYSALVLATPSAGSQQDGILYAYEIERLHLSADLVVLSACDTGRGQSRGAEGTLALDRAFLVAGAKAVVSSLWAVNDRSTDALMIAFYGRIKAGRPADVALAEAMNAVRRRPEWADPYYWSAFRLIGDGAR